MVSGARDSVAAGALEAAEGWPIQCLGVRRSADRYRSFDPVNGLTAPPTASSVSETTDAIPASDAAASAARQVVVARLGRSVHGARHPAAGTTHRPFTCLALGVLHERCSDLVGSVNRLISNSETFSAQVSQPFDDSTHVVFILVKHDVAGGKLCVRHAPVQTHFCRRCYRDDVTIQ